jgi:hypothetical protein
MRTPLLSLLLVLLSVYGGNAQIINQDADGKSAIIWSGGTIGLDVTQAAVKFNYLSPSENSFGFNWGADLQGKSKEGFSALFESNDLVPEARASAIFGVHFSPSWVQVNDPLQQGDVSAADLTTAGLAAEAAYKNEVDNAALLITDTGTNAVTCGRAQGEFKVYVRGLIQTVGYKGLLEAIKKAPFVLEPSPCSGQVVAATARLVSLVTANADIRAYIDLEAKRDNYVRLPTSKTRYNSQISQRYYLYFRPGISATKFTYDRGAMLTVPASRFRDTAMVGGTFELGLSGRIAGSHYFGVSLGRERLSTFGALLKTEYKFSNTLPGVMVGKLDTTKNITAYAGILYKTWANQINIDYTYLSSLDKDNYLALGAYWRHSVPINSTALQQTDIVGVNAYFLDGKKGRFLGGVYLQSDDVSGQTEKNFGKSITFGLVSKFAFSSAFR